MNPMQKDAEVWEIYRKEYARQEEGLELIASENYASPAVMAAQGGIFTNKYAEGYPGKRYYGGNEFIDMGETLAIERAKKLFGTQHANVQPHAGSQANMAAYYALMQQGDKFMGLNLAQGGHLTHGSPVNFSGKLYHPVAFDVHPQTHLLDYGAIAQLADKERPKIIIAGFTCYPRQIDFAKFRKIADECGAKLMVDMAHISGLIAGGVHPDPAAYADVITSTTHKTLRGPRGAMILCKTEYAQAIDKAVFPGLQGGPLEHAILAKAICFHEAMQPDFKNYAKQVVANAKALAKALDGLGFTLVSGGTDTHLMLLDLRSKNITGKDAENLLDAAGISTNRNSIPNDPQKPFITSGLRIGTPALTTRGMKENEMEKVAHWIADVLNSPQDAQAKEKVKKEVKHFTKDFPIYPNLPKA